MEEKKIEEKFSSPASLNLRAKLALTTSRAQADNTANEAQAKKCRQYHQLVGQMKRAAAKDRVSEYEYTSNSIDLRADVKTRLVDVDGLTMTPDTNQSFTYSYTFSWAAA